MDDWIRINALDYLKYYSNVQRTFRRAKPEQFMITSRKDPTYNCHAYAAGDQNNWWEPDTPPNNPETYWPPNVPKTYKLSSYKAAFEMHGFVECDNGDPEDEFIKIALYVDDNGDCTHAALRDGNKWLSKLGDLEDIEHTSVDFFEARDYGLPKIYMRKRR